MRHSIVQNGVGVRLDIIDFLDVPSILSIPGSLVRLVTVWEEVS